MTVKNYYFNLFIYMGILGDIYKMTGEKTRDLNPNK